MALLLKSSVCNSCQRNQVLIYDKTGAYGATNLTGWGSPNAAIADVDTATVTLTAHDGTEYDPINVLATLPNTADVPFVLVPSLLLLSTVAAFSSTSAFTGGIWICDYQVTGITGSTPFNYRSRKAFLIDCGVACCVDEAMSGVDPLCGCTQGQSKKAMQKALALDAINYALQCGKIAQARVFYDRLAAMCNNGCTNC